MRWLLFRLMFLSGVTKLWSGDAAWTDLRILIFTEYEDTKRYIVNMLRAAIAGTQRRMRRL